MESMPEYRRFIAYFYEYIDGKKSNNVGFAKVELRSGMWRILFRLTAVHSPEPPVQVYGFVRERGYLLGLLMGTMRSGNQMLEEWAYHAGNPIWKRTYGFSDLAGIWIQCGDGRRYVTVWDDDPIEINRFVLELPEKEEVEKGETEAAAAVAWTDENVNETEASLPPGNGKMPPEDNVKVEAAQLAEDGIYTELNRQSKPSSPCETIAQRREAFEPFEDAEFESCVKILPCDLVALQQAGLQVGRSSFLLHGFYQYHHLLLGRRADGSFVLGIPGLHNSQERYMAQTFGFTDFKTAKWKDRGRQFGYWYKIL